MLKILKVFGKLDRGGAELRTLELIREINNIETEQLEIHIISLSGERGVLDEQYEKEGVKIHYIPIKSKDFLKNFHALIKKENYNVLYSNVFLFSGFFMFIGYILKVPKRVSHIRTLFDEKKGIIRKIRNGILKILMKVFATDIVGVNKAVIKENFGIKQLSNPKTTILYNGIPNLIQDSQRILAKSNINSNRKINLIHIGRMTKAKNHLKLIDIFIEINKLIPGSELHLVGKEDPHILEEINKKLSDNNIIESVSILGVSDDVDIHLKDKNLMIFPSSREGLPGVVIEAIKNGIPVLASDISPHRELKNYFSILNLAQLGEESIEWANHSIQIMKKSINTEVLSKEIRQSPFTMEHHIDSYLKMLYMKK